MTSMFLILGIIFVLSFVALAFVAVRTYWRFRAPRAVTCPETGEAAAVEVRPAKPPTSTSSTGSFHESLLRLSSCTRWPERQDCEQECLPQVEETPDEWLVRERLTQQYRDAPCVLCGKTIGAIRFERKSGTNADQKIDWSGIKPEDLPGLLATHEPVCWNCHLAESFLRHFPDRAAKGARKPVSQKPETDTKLVS